MAGLKPLSAAATVFLLAGVLGLETGRHNSTESAPLPAVAIHVQRRNLVQERYRAYAKRLQKYYHSLVAALKAEAPDLLFLLEPPAPPRHGYQILPEIIATARSAPERPRARSAWYSWPWTDKLIVTALVEIMRSETRLNAAAAVSSAARRSVYEELARNYSQVRARQQNIDGHIQYNRLWQAAIAADRAAYDRETILHNAVLERQAVLDALNTASGSAGKKKIAGAGRLHRSQTVAEMQSHLIEQEKLLSREIRDATSSVNTPEFVRIEHRGPHLWIIHVPFYTDIEDQGFVRWFKDTVEAIWRVRDGRDEFRVEVDISIVPMTELYANREGPRQGENIDARAHLAFFSPDRAVLTTGAITTNVYGRAIILGPHDITPEVLAHEFGHILGFKDTYFRAYKDLGRDGFQVMEVVADANDIMGAPASGPVLRQHFDRLLEQLGKEKRRHVGTGNMQRLQPIAFARRANSSHMLAVETA